MEAAAARIVVGVDGSAASLDAIRWAVHYAEVTGQQLEAVTTWEYSGQYGYEFTGEEPDWETIARSTLAVAITEAARGHDGPITQRVAQGHPSQVLTDASVGADLLVVGSRGHGGFAGMLLGSVSQYVSAHAHCPVVVVRHQDPAEGPR